jgi:hypothetical protein
MLEGVPFCNSRNDSFPQQNKKGHERNKKMTVFYWDVDADGYGLARRVHMMTANTGPPFARQAIFCLKRSNARL